MKSLIIITVLFGCLYANSKTDANSTAVKEKLDSIVQVDEVKVECTYSNEGRIKHVVYSNWASNRWEKSKRFEYSYDINGNIITFVVKRWGSNVWDNRNKYEYIFDTSNNISVVNYYDHFLSSNWTQEAKYEYTYDNNKYISQLTGFSLDSNQWVPVIKNEYTCDFLGHITSVVNIRLQNGEWMNNEKADYKYNVNKNYITEMIHYGWSIMDEWEILFKFEYNYNSSDNTTLIH